jgi:hypothetical protein
MPSRRLTGAARRGQRCSIFRFGGLHPRALTAVRARTGVPSRKGFHRRGRCVVAIAVASSLMLPFESSRRYSDGGVRSVKLGELVQDLRALKSLVSPLRTPSHTGVRLW